MKLTEYRGYLLELLDEEAIEARKAEDEIYCDICQETIQLNEWYYHDPISELNICYKCYILSSFSLPEADRAIT